jgi:hypothetical protein
MTKPKPPVFHIPVGRTRGKNGKVVLFQGPPGSADQASTVAAWHEMILSHPATLAAGACVIIGPTTTSYLDLQTRTALQSRSADGAWKPSAATDPPDGERAQIGAPNIGWLP